MREGWKILDEIVVLGYGNALPVVSRCNGSIASVSSESLNNQELLHFCG